MKYVVFAGVNGAGKTTLYQTNKRFFEMPRVNIDEIVRETGSWKKPKDVFKAGKLAVKTLDEFLRTEFRLIKRLLYAGKVS